MVCIIKYNAGNIASVKNAVERLGHECIITDDKAEIRRAGKVIFPGVGEASSAMGYLKERELDTVIKSLDQPVLGICLGLQLLCRYKFPLSDIVPHIGWNNLEHTKSSLFEGFGNDDAVYFVHSYYAEICTQTIAECDYILPFSASIQNNNFFATQFHPEKSANVGERILIIGGKCVRLTKGDYSTQKIYNENPVEVAKEFEANGIRYLHLVDLDGAKSKHIVNKDILREISTKTSLTIDFGGGIKTDEDVRIAFENGAAQITVGSIAAQQPDLFLKWLSMYGPDKIILGADSYGRKIAIHGWQQQSELDVVDFIADYERKGIKYVICTDISKDGMLQGTSNELYTEILQGTNVKLIASGGVSSIDDLVKIKRMGCEGAIIGKAIYEGSIKLNELHRFSQSVLAKVQQ